ncbi:hypothetical protein VSU19_09290 [Verrucomicrobiales bacterium BCK34]|nr:hypothetical protein [Verrucomicrobiales bacterium BCK34]
MSNSPSSRGSNRVLMGRAAQCGLVSLFLLFLVWPWIVELVAPGEDNSLSGGGSLQSRLKHLEDRVKSLSFFVNERPADQSFMEDVFREGNAKVYIGQDDWLYYRPDLEAVFGKGPLYVEPSSVAREKVADTWEPPLDVIEGFAKQLDERGIELVIVPVPTKPMLSRSGLGLDGRDEFPGLYESVLAELSMRGIEAVDLLPVLETLPESSRFLKYDTHWTPVAMGIAAKHVAGVVSEKIEEAKHGDLKIEWISEKRFHSGDLAGMLDRSGDSEEEVELSIPQGAVTDDTDAPIVLLGDSFVNIYDEPGLGFGDEKDEKIGAGFAAQLSAGLAQPVQMIAINGDGATAVRREFASLPDKALRSKKVVVWVLSARDLLLAELPARRAGIRWVPVEFRKSEAEPVATEIGQLTVAATVSELSQFADPRETAYKDAVYSLLLSELAVENGEHGKEEIYAFAWAFRDRVLQKSAHFEGGKRYRFTLVPMKEAAEVSSATQVDDLFRTDLDPWFIKDFEPLP